MSSLTLAEATRIVREATKDKTYQSFPLGLTWAAFLRAKRHAGCRPNTLESYESVGDKFARYFADLADLHEIEAKPEFVLDFLEATWPDVDQDTLQQRWAVMDSFFKWAYRTDRVARDPMGKLERPKRKRGKQAARPRIPQEHLLRLVSEQQNLRDQAALLLLGRLGLRREDLRLLQLRDIDMGTNNILLLHAKGGNEHTLPIAFRDVRETLYLHLQERGGHRDEYLVYPKTQRSRPLSTSGIDQWFRKCMTRAELGGYTMHQLRHAAIDEVQRRTHDAEAARGLARHANLATTQTYLHSDLETLREALAAMDAEEIMA